ncbi:MULTISPECIES: FAD-binding oxidoreductase [unclassified Marinobacter]|uniref:FAD-binding oxidoreductase n=1 Tax=unclassified Marinobacter TaxID=83889 RepID=UPI0026E32422|nr:MULTISPECIES: FAD-binding oxidoreductase [unclassified Marinobacter]MDO6442510.1 FAD-binding oxidoreductase [Marinobacter sp. 2_MG-2023]MDO6824566.1 FAD-binding oxidoreductase [Marinobacter sp. 1_MG-2023]
MNRTSTESAIAEWVTILGEPAVITARAADFGISTIGTKRSIPAVLRPENQEQVAAVLQVAQKWQVAVYPVSTGNNWGYGSANPVENGCVILDLSRLNRISGFDPELGVVTVEPGVTQGALREFLDSHDGNYLVPVTGAGPTCSILGNALERGYGITPITDHFAAVTRIEAVLPDGSLYRTPLSELGGAEVDGLFKWGLGPYLDGLFSQGNFGVVVNMTIALAPVPDTVTAFFFSTKEDEKLEALVPAVREVLRALGGSVVAINLLNSQRMLSMMTPFPEDKAVDGVLPAHEVESLANRHGVPAWSGVGAIYASKEVARAARRTLRRLLGPATDRLIFINQRKVEMARTFARVMPGGLGTRVKGMADTLAGALEIMHGTPNDVALALAYWRSGALPAPGQPKNPARDGCGLIWFAPLVPIRSNDARRYIQMVERVCPQYGVNPLITLTTVNDRCFDSTVPLLFDRNDTEATARANDCYRALYAAGQREGFLPYRLNIDAMDILNTGGSVYSGLTSKLKAAVDPNFILAPGRYVPRVKRSEV